ncbi:MAG TPA: endopeptidase La [Tissierellaceae bacterium]|nr:endopeptidase La [Tissierellaceae bacterium]
MINNQYNVEKVTLPLIPLRGMSMFPHMVIHFDVGRDKSVKALEKAMLDDSNILLCSQMDPKIEDPNTDEFYQIGTISKVKQMLKLPGGSIRVLVEGVNRGKIVNILDNVEYFEAEIEKLVYNEDEVVKDIDMEAVMRLVITDLEEYINYNNKVSSEVLLAVYDIEDPGRLADIIASYVFLEPEDNQKILETFDFYKRLEVLHSILQEEIELLKIENEIDQKVKKNINRVQKEYYLKEQIKAIQDELGEGEDILSEVDNYKKEINKISMSEEVREKILKEADRLSRMSPNSPETDGIRTYLDWIIELPWDKESKGEINIKKSRDILNEDHYGLEDVKERILEFIAVRKLTDSMKGPILCLVGPPGVGKTSIAKSVARSLEREFVRMSLGGVRDEAEIRGHRRTYVGSMPGKIISSMRKSGTKNPVFLFDEIDKLGSDYRGDPASGLLEVLDPEQNNTFTDRFLDVPFDLSKVLFLTTANTTNTIPAALLDRMEVIKVSGYTEEEKVQIALNYLLPKQIEEHGLKEENLNISEPALRSVINNYTREAGVRNLERNIASICRKAAKRIVEENIEVVRINIGSVSNYLGIPRYRYDKLDEDNQVGVANGLAWTAVGGETLSIEANIMKGTGKIQLTGKLGDVMKESAMAGISYIRANTESLNIKDDFYKDMDIHIHVPEGAIPKDGPSAGITLATAVVSALSNIPTNKNIAMTGEITLRGYVLPVGGIKEKVLAANRLGIKKVLLPYGNKKDLEDIPSKVKRQIEFVLVDNLAQVLDHVLLKEDEENEDN